MNIVTNVLSIRLLFSIAITNYSTPVTIELVVGSTEVGFLNIKAYQYFLEKLFNLINITVVYKKVDTKFICYCLNKDVVEHIEEYGDNFNSNKMAIWLEKFVHFDKNISSKYIKKNCSVQV